MLPETSECCVCSTEEKFQREYEKLFYTDDFNSFAKKLIDDEVNYPKDERLIIPFVDETEKIYAAQGRRLTDNDTAKYYTAKPSDV